MLKIKHLTLTTLSALFLSSPGARASLQKNFEFYEQTSSMYTLELETRLATGKKFKTTDDFLEYYQTLAKKQLASYVSSVAIIEGLNEEMEADIIQKAIENSMLIMCSYLNTLISNGLNQVVADHLSPGLERNALLTAELFLYAQTYRLSEIGVDAYIEESRELAIPNR